VPVITCLLNMIIIDVMEFHGSFIFKFYYRDQLSGILPKPPDRIVIVMFNSCTSFSCPNNLVSSYDIVIVISRNRPCPL